MQEKYPNNAKPQEEAILKPSSGIRRKGNRLLDRMQKNIPSTAPPKKTEIREFKKEFRNTYKPSLFTNRETDIKNPEVAQRMIGRQILDQVTKIPPTTKISPKKGFDEQEIMVQDHLNLAPLYDESASLKEIDKVFKTESPDTKVAHDLIRAHKIWIVKRHFNKFKNPDLALAIALIKAGEKDFVEVNKEKFKGFNADSKALDLDHKKIEDSPKPLKFNAEGRGNKIQSQQYAKKLSQHKTSEGKKLSLNPRNKKNDDRLIAQKESANEDLIN